MNDKLLRLKVLFAFIIFSNLHAHVVMTAPAPSPSSIMYEPVVIKKVLNYSNLHNTMRHEPMAFPMTNNSSYSRYYYHFIVTAPSTLKEGNKLHMQLQYDWCDDREDTYENPCFSYNGWLSTVITQGPQQPQIPNNRDATCPFGGNVAYLIPRQTYSFLIFCSECNHRTPNDYYQHVDNFTVTALFGGYESELPEIDMSLGVVNTNLSKYIVSDV